MKATGRTLNAPDRRHGTLFLTLTQRKKGARTAANITTMTVTTSEDLEHDVANLMDTTDTTEMPDSKGISNRTRNHPGRQ